MMNIRAWKIIPLNSRRLLGFMLICLILIGLPSAVQAGADCGGAVTPAVPQSGVPDDPRLSAPGAAGSGVPGDSAWTFGYIATIVSWTGLLSSMADHVFAAMVVIEFAVMMIVFFMQGRENLGELFGDVVKKVLTFALFYWILVKHGYQIAMTIISSFTNTGFDLAATGSCYNTATPDSLFQQGFNLAIPMIIYAVIFAALPNFFSAWFFSIGFTNWQLPIIAVQLFGATAVIGAFTFMAGALLLTTFEAYLVTIVGTMMAGFSAFRLTHSYGSQKLLSYAFSVGIKLMMLNLCIGLVQSVLVPSIQGQSGIPLLGSVEAGFSALLASLIVQNASTFAAGIVTGMANGNFSSTMGAVTGAIGGAQAIAQGMQQTAHATKEMMQAEKAESSVKNESHANSAAGAKASEQTPPANPTILSQQQPQGGSPNSGSGGPNGTSGDAAAPSNSSLSVTPSHGGSGGNAQVAASANASATASTSGSGSNGQQTHGSASANANAPEHHVGGLPNVQKHQDSEAFSSYRQHMDARFGANSGSLSKEESSALDKAILEDKKGLAKGTGEGMDRTIKGMEGLLKPAMQEGPVGAVNIRSSV